jgi:hypothetical protein
MTDTLSTDAVKDKTVKRNGSGELIPETHTIDWDGEDMTVKTVPITTGVVNELSHIDDEIMNLQPQAVHEAMQAIYVEPDFDEFTVEDVADLELKYLEALMEPLDKQLSENVKGNR